VHQCSLHFQNLEIFKISHFYVSKNYKVKYIGVKIWCTWAQVISFLNKLKIIFLSFKKYVKILACSQLFIAPTCKNSCANTLYFGLHKNDKHLYLSLYISIYKFYHILLFLCSPQYKEFYNKSLYNCRLYH
jgi:hypothetical protein